MSHLDAIVEIYLKVSSDETAMRLSVQNPSQLGTYLVQNAESSTKHILIESINQLEPSFKRFKQTKSFVALYKKVKEFEEISQKIYM